MVNFTSPPAFGFETATCNAEGYYKEQAKKVIQKALDFQKREMAKINIPGSQAEIEMPDFTSDLEYQQLIEQQYNIAAKSLSLNSKDE